MKRLILPIALLLIFGTSALQAQAPVKKVLLEEFTGTWCGWCPRGIWAIEQLETKYPNQFIPVSVHNQDPMTTPQGDTLQASVPGFPDGWVDRLPQADGTRNSDPTAWDSIITAHLNDPVVAGVAIKNVKYNAITRVVTADVNVNFVAAASGDIRINMYVVEDSVSGPAGSTFDQHNYLTGLNGYQDNPFFSLPTYVPTYQHMHVVRAILGGTWGKAGIIPASVSAGGSYTASFSYTLPPNVKPDQSRLVGMAFAYSSVVSKNIVYNADMVPVTNLPLITGFNAIAPKQYSVVPRSTQTMETISLNNTGNADLQVSVSIDSANTIVPAGWNVSFASTVKVPAGKSVLDTLIISTPAKANYLMLSLNILPVSDNGVAHLTPISVNALSAGTKYVCFGPDGFMDNHMDASYNNDYAAMPYDANTIAAYPPETFDVGIFPNVNYLDVEGVDGFPPPLATTANTMLAAGKKVFITSTFGLYWAFDAASPYSSYTGVDASTLLTTLGIDYVALKNRANSSTGNPTTSIVNGFTGDAVGDGVKFTDYFYQTDVFTINSPTTTVPVIYLDSKQSTLGGFRYDDGKGNRAVYLDLNFGLVTSANSTGATKLITQSMNFLVNGVNAVEPAANLATSLSNFPNPVSSETKINYSVSDRTPVMITVHDVLGREVARVVNTTQEAGNYSVNFDASNLPSGSYTYILNAGGKTIEKTMTVTK